MGPNVELTVTALVSYAAEHFLQKTREILLYLPAMRLPDARQWRFSSMLKVPLVFLCLTWPTWLLSQTISGTVQDPSGAFIAGARIEITGPGLAQPVVLSSDASGKFASPDLTPGSYSLRIVQDGFEPLAKTVELQASVQLQLTLAIAKQQVNISVAGKSLAFANSDPLYRQLRGLGLGETFRFDNFTLLWDVATFQFQKGTLTFLSPVNGIVTGAIFIGEGHFNLKPVTPLDARELSRRTGGDEFNEDFTEAVFRFTGDARLGSLPRTGGSNRTFAEAAVSFTTGARGCGSAANNRGFYPVYFGGRNHGQRGRRPSGRHLQ